MANYDTTLNESGDSVQYTMESNLGSVLAQLEQLGCDMTALTRRTKRAEEQRENKLKPDLRMFQVFRERAVMDSSSQEAAQMAEHSLNNAHQKQMAEEMHRTKLAFGLARIRQQEVGLSKKCENLREEMEQTLQRLHQEENKKRVFEKELDTLHNKVTEKETVLAKIHRRNELLKQELRLLDSADVTFNKLFHTMKTNYKKLETFTSFAAITLQEAKSFVNEEKITQKQENIQKIQKSVAFFLQEAEHASLERSMAQVEREEITQLIVNVDKDRDCLKKDEEVLQTMTKIVQHLRSLVKYQ